MAGSGERSVGERGRGGGIDERIGKGEEGWNDEGRGCWG